jgi:transposase
MKSFKDIAGFVKDKKVFCGIDIHEKKWEVCFICDGEVVQSERISAEYPKLKALLAPYILSRGLEIVYEAGFSGTWLYRRLTDDGYSCMITPPGFVPMNTDKVKTDKRDARKLASYLSAGLLKSVYVLPAWAESDRRIVRRRSQLVKKCRRAKSEIHSFLHLHGIKRPLEIKSNWSGLYLKWLDSLEFEFKPDKFVLGQLIKNYRRIRDDVAEVTQQLRNLSKSEAYAADFKRITAVKGVGLITAMTFLLEVHDFSRFESNEHFSSLLGLTPSQHSSGEKTRYGHITRQGNAELRRVLIESAWSVIRYDPHLRAKYERIRSRGTNGKKAIVAVARCLAVRMRHCILHEEDYVVGVC